MNTYSLTETLAVLANAPQALLYLSGTNCGVCHVMKSRVQALAEKHALTALEINLTEQPEAVAAFEVLTVPAVLLYAHGREYHRQARFIDLTELSERIQNPPLSNTDYAEIFKQAV
ncbi:thioredoxin family protein [Neisseria sp. CCUG12390]|uniref:thioredoxin family protein n=1 Tax=Neisseria sp. CCUG12390 TaxID=3392035 RepID=UPI003A0FDF2E